MINRILFALQLVLGKNSTNTVVDPDALGWQLPPLSTTTTNDQANLFVPPARGRDDDVSNNVNNNNNNKDSDNNSNNQKNDSDKSKANSKANDSNNNNNNKDKDNESWRYSKLFTTGGWASLEIHGHLRGTTTTKNQKRGSSKPPLQKPPKVGLVGEGRVVDAGDYPFFVFVRSLEDGSMCAGTLVHADIVLTSAQCYDQFASAEYVAIGGIQPDGSDAVERIGVLSMFPHPDFNPDTLENDIMMVQLKEFSAIHQTAINSGPDAPDIGDLVTMLGFNHTFRNTDNNNNRTDSGEEDMSSQKTVTIASSSTTTTTTAATTLQQVDISALELDACHIKKDKKSSPTSSFDYWHDPRMQICAGNVQDNSRTYQISCHDQLRGAPLLDLTFMNEDGYYGIQLGLLSYNEGCHGNGNDDDRKITSTPAVFTRISFYILWVIDSVCKQSARYPGTICDDVAAAILAQEKAAAAEAAAAGSSRNATYQTPVPTAAPAVASGAVMAEVPPAAFTPKTPPTKTMAPTVNRNTNIRTPDKTKKPIVPQKTDAPAVVVVTPAPTAAPIQRPASTYYKGTTTMTASVPLQPPPPRNNIIIKPIMAEEKATPATLPPVQKTEGDDDEMLLEWLNQQYSNSAVTTTTTTSSSSQQYVSWSGKSGKGGGSNKRSKKSSASKSSSSSTTKSSKKGSRKN